MNPTKLYEYLKLLGLIVGLLAPGLTFYSVTRVQLAQQELRIADLEKRQEKIESQQTDKFDKLIESVSVIRTDIAVIKSQLR